MMVKCKICSSDSNKIFTASVLGKYEVGYFQCGTCNFIQTEEPYWLDEAYSSPIAIMDVGLLYRNINFSNDISSMLDKCTKKGDSYLDYGGGYGVFVRMMRDKGYDFYLYDKFCENLFAKFFELENSPSEKFEALTALEVFEHLINPLEEINKMWTYSDIILFSTELQPDIKIRSEKDWWYFVPYGGQHVSMYHKKTLSKLGEVFGCQVFTNGSNLHALARKNIDDPFRLEPNKGIFSRIKEKLRAKEQRESLLQKDWEYYKSKLNIF